MEYTLFKDIELVLAYKSMRLEEFSKGCGVPFEVLSRIKNKKIKPSFETLEKIYSYIYSLGIHLNENKVEILKKNHDIVLFHGAKEELIGQISLEYSRKHVDFGRGFYTGDNYNQSLEFVAETEKGSVYVLDVDYTGLKVLKLELSLDWMLFILFNRGRLEEYKDHPIYKRIQKLSDGYDVIIGPIADNRMFDTINAFLDSVATTSQAYHALKSINLGNQIVFKSEKSLKQIKLVNRLFVSREEKDEIVKAKQKYLEESDQYVRQEYSKHIREGEYIVEVFK